MKSVDVQWPSVPDSEGCRYIEMRQRLLPHLEKEHDHSWVAVKDLQERLLTHLSSSAFTASGVLNWQLHGRGHPCLLGELTILIPSAL